MDRMQRLLFVCLGNICRSPAAEAVMQSILNSKGLDDSIQCDSAGTSGWHEGEKADTRMRKHGQARGYAVTSISRKVRAPEDFETFDYILAMDDKNLQDLQALDSSGIHHHKIHRIVDFCTTLKVDEVPDPYYGGDAGFANVLDILEDACNGLLLHLQRESNTPS